MKKIKLFWSSLYKWFENNKTILIMICFVCFSCNEKEFLKEKPLDFYAPENSYITFENFESAVLNLYVLTRAGLWDSNSPRDYLEGTDLEENFYELSGAHKNEIRWSALGGLPDGPWNLSYQVIYDANVIIGRSESDVSKLTASQKTLIQAEAKFFRAYFYKILANLFGGVPIVLEETKIPKRDYVRATRQEVYEQCAKDLEFAAANLMDIDEVDESRINKLAASHVLAEVYISLSRWQDAIEEASKVINHPGVALMTERFGSELNNPDFGGDVYWDLFRGGNQDRFIGNTESIWVLQHTYNVPGGGNYILERLVNSDLTKAMIKQSNGKLSPVLAKPNTYVSGRGQGFLRPSTYFLGTLWQKSGYNQDIRNSKYNIIRDVKVLNPANEYNGKWVIADKLPLVKVTNEDTARYFYEMIMKVITTPGKTPKEFWDPDQSIPGSLLGTTQQTWRKHYMVRLAETYLLRAEAYLGSGNAAKAAEDINVVRRRANAPDVAAANVDIDYILDERLRELNYEELRVITLARLGKIVDRTKRLNPNIGKYTQDYQNLWAIPYSEISKNVGATLEQNPGY